VIASEAARSRRRASAVRFGRRRSVCSPLPDEVATEVLLGGQTIVGTAAQREVVDGRWAFSRMRVQVMELEPGSLPATLAPVVYIHAARLVPLPDAAADFGRDVATVVRCLWRGMMRVGRRPRLGAYPRLRCGGRGARL
jgi:hypothetical protein